MKNVMTCLALAIGLTACGGGGGGDGSSGGTSSPPSPAGAQTVTLSYNFEDFTEVTVRNSFEIIVQEGDQYSIQVTIDEEYSDLVAVAKEGIRLRVGFRDDYTGDIRATTMQGIVTLPQLSVIEVDNSASVVIAGFSSSYLEVDLSGNSVLEGANNVIDLVAATLSGSSQLKFQDIAPLPAAHTELSGSSQATVNLMSGGTLTGSASGSSSLFYYGDNIFLDVAIYNTASVTRLGGTR